jgi:hypothetical protein
LKQRIIAFFAMIALMSGLGLAGAAGANAAPPIFGSPRPLCWTMGPYYENRVAYVNKFVYKSEDATHCYYKFYRTWTGFNWQYLEVATVYKYR